MERLVLFLFRRVFFRRKLARLQALQHAGRSLTRFLDLKEISNFIVNTVAEVMSQRVSALILRDRPGERFWVASSVGLALASVRKVRFEEHERFVRFLSEHRGLAERERTLRQFSWPEVYEISKGFEMLGAAYVMPLFADDIWLGFLALSGKKGGELFSEDEARTLEEFGQAAGLPLRNALAFEDLKRMNERLKDLQSKLLQTTQMTAIEQLASGIAHEIHNPLTIISGKAQLLLLKRREELDEKTVEETLKTIVKQTERAADITRKLLVFSETSSSGRDVIHFGNIVDDTLALISYQTMLDEITIVKTLSSDLPAFHGEINEMREVFLNLVLNAVQAVERKGTVEILIRYLDKEGWIEIKIRDTGKGIRAEDIPRLFNPFFTTRDGALGLGLFVTRQIVLRYRGSIHVESELGKGTVVVIHLPVPAPSHYDQMVDGNREEIGVDG
jgi:signal transduction histidine kinase